MIEALKTARRRGTKNETLCRFFTWFWFARENRESHGQTKVKVVLGPSTFRVDKDGSRQTIWLRAPGCIGYEYPRQVFICIGELLRRYRWFQEWNRERCPICEHDKFRSRYRDYIEGTLCEDVQVCVKCLHEVCFFAYGSQENFAVRRWEQWEDYLFGSINEPAH